MNKPYPYYEHDVINNLQELLDRSIKKNENGLAFFYNDENKNIINKTYRDFYDDVMYLRNYLFKNFHNTHIGIIGENSYEWLVLFFAIILSGNVGVIIDKDLDSEVIKTLLKKSDTKTVFISRNYSKVIDLGKYKTFSFDDIKDFINEGKKGKCDNEIDDDKDAVIFFTSGTTGANKGVVLSQKNIASNIHLTCSIFKLDGSTIALLPFHHAFGLITCALKPFFYGYPIFINSSLRNVMSELLISKPQTLLVVPAFVEKFYKQIWSTARKTKKDKLLKALIKTSNAFLKVGIDMRKKLFKSVTSAFGGNLEYIICGGAYLDVKYVKWFRSIGIEILNGYGITECSPVVSTNRNHYHRDGSVGQLIKNCQVKIVDDEIVIKSDCVMKGYYKDKAATNAVLKDGWFYTGDLGYIDEDGFLFITGRKKNLIILSNGENVSPETIEEELYKDKGVCEVIVYEKNGQMLAQIYPEEDYMGDQEHFDKLINEYNKKVPRNRQIALVILRNTEFIKNTNRKILRNKVEE